MKLPALSVEAQTGVALGLTVVLAVITKVIEHLAR